MVTGKYNDDYTFYKGYEGEPELILTSEDGSIHIWDGYIGDIFGNPIKEKKEWSGFTRDYNEFVGPYDDENIVYSINVIEYLDDAVRCREKKTEFEESSNVLEAIISWLNNHKKTDVQVRLG